MNQDENLGPMKLIFNYNNIFYSFFLRRPQRLHPPLEGVCTQLCVFR